MHFCWRSLSLPLSPPDDLRAWTLPPAPHRRASIPIHLSAETYTTVAEQFPYMVDTARATGGGDVPSLRFEVFRTRADGMPEAFEVEGVRITPLPVHHGRYFTPPAVAVAAAAGVAGGAGAGATSIAERPPRAIPTVTPFLCYGFLFDGRMAWLSDINHMPAKTWDRMVQVVREEGPGGSAIGRAGVTGHANGRANGHANGHQNGHTNGRSHANGHSNGHSNGYANGHANGTDGTVAHAGVHRQIQHAKWSLVEAPGERPVLTPGQLPYLIIDTLFMREHPSHLSFLQTVKSARDIDAQRTLCVGFTHPLAHAEWLAGYRAIDASPAAAALPREERMMSEIKQHAAQQGMQAEWDEAKAWGGCVRPAWDGQRIGLDVEGRVVRYEDEDNEKEWA